ncbi:ceruloplasmin-like [Thalassophryne amazonica]|uniref:ceruloplasmin-like n=1 Tax=Thalassophryne amazonica TaxID=390379 RepID=UPI0014725668|nr:ceruloplasmin-like [Thalassophryne amazonica]
MSLKRWRYALERRGMKVTQNKVEYSCVTEEESGRMMLLQGRDVVKKNYAKEYHLLAAVFDENLSWYLDDNIKTFTTAPTTVNKEDDGFMESNQMHAINGFVYRNLPGLTMCKGDKVTWHLSGLGTELNIHSLHFQGNRFIYRQNRRDAITLTSHISHTVTMEPDSMSRQQHELQHELLFEM